MSGSSLGLFNGQSIGLSCRDGVVMEIARLEPDLLTELDQEEQNANSEWQCMDSIVSSPQ